MLLFPPLFLARRQPLVERDSSQLVWICGVRRRRASLRRLRLFVFLLVARQHRGEIRRAVLQFPQLQAACILLPFRQRRERLAIRNLPEFAQHPIHVQCVVVHLLRTRPSVHFFDRSRFLQRGARFGGGETCRFLCWHTLLLLLLYFRQHGCAQMVRDDGVGILLLEPAQYGFKVGGGVSQISHIQPALLPAVVFQPHHVFARGGLPKLAQHPIRVVQRPDLPSARARVFSIQPRDVFALLCLFVQLFFFLLQCVVFPLLHRACPAIFQNLLNRFLLLGVAELAFARVLDRLREILHAVLCVKLADRSEFIENPIRGQSFVLHLSFAVFFVHVAKSRDLVAIARLFFSFFFSFAELGQARGLFGLLLVIVGANFFVPVTVGHLFHVTGRVLVVPLVAAGAPERSATLRCDSKVSQQFGFVFERSTLCASGWLFPAVWKSKFALLLFHHQFLMRRGAESFDVFVC